MLFATNYHPFFVQDFLTAYIHTYIHTYIYTYVQACKHDYNETLYCCAIALMYTCTGPGVCCLRVQVHKLYLTICLGVKMFKPVDQS